MRHMMQHVDGHEVRVARKHVTQPGFVLKIKGEGMPQHNFPSEKGDLFVEFTVSRTSLLHCSSHRAGHASDGSVPTGRQGHC